MDVRFFFLLNIFRTNGQNLTRLYKCIYIDRICVNRIFTCYILQICNKVIALDWQHNFVSSQYLEDKWIYKIYFGIAIFHILLICNRVMPLMDVRILVLLNIFRTNGQNLTRLYKCIYIDKICVNRIFTCYLLQICNKVMALVWQQDFVSVQYLEYKWIEFHQIL